MTRHRLVLASLAVLAASATPGLVLAEGPSAPPAAKAGAKQAPARTPAKAPARNAPAQQPSSAADAKNAAPTPTTASSPASRLAAISRSAVESFNQRNWAGAAAAAESYVKELDANSLPHAGVDFATVEFIGGVARYEMYRADPNAFKYDYKKDVLDAMEDSLKIVQDEPFFRHNTLGSAYYEKLRAGHFHDLELENPASWHMYRALMARQEELQMQGRPLTSEEYTAFAKYVLQYVQRSMEMARYSEVPDVYLVRIREACRMGFGTQFDSRFAQLYQVIGFDSGNVRAGVLMQAALDMMAAEGSKPEDVVATYKEAVKAAHGSREKAEIYRSMADFASRQDPYDYKLQAVEYGRQAYLLDGTNKEIQQQYGTSLHVISYAQFNTGHFDDALRAAREATSFQWDGDEVAFFDLSRAEANFGDKINALTHAEQSYDKARRKYGPEELAPFRQNYVNILRQFGLSARATQVEADGHGS